MILAQILGKTLKKSRSQPSSSSYFGGPLYLVLGEKELLPFDHYHPLEKSFCDWAFREENQILVFNILNFEAPLRDREATFVPKNKKETTISMTPSQ